MTKFIDEKTDVKLWGAAALVSAREAAHKMILLIRHCVRGGLEQCRASSSLLLEILADDSPVMYYYNYNNSSEDDDTAHLGGEVREGRLSAL